MTLPVTTFDSRRPLYEAAGAFHRAALAEREAGDRIRMTAWQYEADGHHDLAAAARAEADVRHAEARCLGAEAQRLRRQGDAIRCPSFVRDPDDADVCLECSDYRCIDCDDHDPHVSTYDDVPLCRDCAHERFRHEPDLPLWIDARAFLTASEELRN